jgi:hypothetical protein
VLTLARLASRGAAYFFGENFQPSSVLMNSHGIGLA